MEPEREYVTVEAVVSHLVDLEAAARSQSCQAASDSRAFLGFPRALRVRVPLTMVSTKPNN